MKKSLISMLVIGLLVFGLVLVGCDNGTTDDPPVGGVIAEQYRGEYAYIGPTIENNDPDYNGARYYVFYADSLVTTETSMGIGTESATAWTEGNIVKNSSKTFGAFETYEAYPSYLFFKNANGNYFVRQVLP